MAGESFGEKYRRFRYWLLIELITPYKYTAGFAGYKQFRNHFKKHQKEYGLKNERRYAVMADKLCGGPMDAGAEECLRKCDQATVRYNNPRNDVGIRHVNNTIGTMFKPINGRAYYLAECRR